MLHGLLLALAVASYLLYGYAIRRWFSREHGVDVRMKLLQMLAQLAALVHGVALSRSSAQPPAQLLAALALYAVGLLIFLAARRATGTTPLTLAFSPDVPCDIVARGIYARIRHPFYTAYSVTWFAGVVAAPSSWTMATAGATIALYGWAARQEERKFCDSPLAVRYRDYCLRAGMFWPR